MRFFKVISWVIILTSIFACSRIEGFDFTFDDFFNKDLQRYIVYSKDNTKKDNGATAKEAIEKAKGKIHKKLRFHNGYVAFINPLDISQDLKRDVIFEKDIRKFASMDGCQKRPEPDQPPPPDEQPKEVYDWGAKRMGADVAHLKNQGEGVKICVIDSGIDFNHVEFSSPNKILACDSFVSGESCIDLNDHGTATSGIIAADLNGVGVVGIAPKAQLIIMKGLDFEGSGYSSDIADAVLGCLDQKADIINMSLGSEVPSNIIHNAIIEAYNAGVYVIAAAGNDSGDVDYPAAFDEVIAVSSMDQRDNISYFSSRGPEVESIAPGSNITSSFPNDNYSTASGTSFSSPVVAGAYALMISSGKNLIYEDLGLTDNEQGQGMINLKEIFK